MLDNIKEINNLKSLIDFSNDIICNEQSKILDFKQKITSLQLDNLGFKLNEMIKATSSLIQWSENKHSYGVSPDTTHVKVIGYHKEYYETFLLVQQYNIKGEWFSNIFIPLSLANEMRDENNI